ncbi:MAG: hypothetical protein HY687_00670 [Chloroflexi bacterium]|nr:hypothetical protein [Chloroflexota bacterium]
MKVQVKRLRSILDLLEPVVPKKPTLPVLTNILLKDGRALANNLEVAVALELPEAEGQCLLPSRPAAELLKRVPGDETLSLEQKGKTLHLAWPGGRASYETPEPKDYPPFPEVVRPRQERPWMGIPWCPCSWGAPAIAPPKRTARCSRG